MNMSSESQKVTVECRDCGVRFETKRTRKALFCRSCRCRHLNNRKQFTYGLYGDERDI